MIRSNEAMPLSEIADRQEAMARCIGPITTLATIRAMDELAVHSAEAVHNDNLSNRLSMRLLEAFENRKDQYSLSIDRMLGHYAASSMSEVQIQLFENHTHHDKDLANSIIESLSAQSQIAAMLTIPAYLSTKDDIDSKDALQYANEYPIHDVATLLGRDDFKKLQRQLSKAPNGTYANLLKGSGHIQPYNVLGVLGNMIETPFNAAISYEEVCIINDEGSIVISSHMREILATLMRLDNTAGIINREDSTLIGSRGCPMNIKAVKSREDDFTEQQWADLIGGPNPPYKFDAERGILTARRNMIDEYSDLLADYLAKCEK